MIEMVRRLGSGTTHLADVDPDDWLDAKVFGAACQLTDQVRTLCGALLVAGDNDGIVRMRQAKPCIRCLRLDGPVDRFDTDDRGYRLSR